MDKSSQMKDHTSDQKIVNLIDDTCWRVMVVVPLSNWSDCIFHKEDETPNKLDIEQTVGTTRLDRLVTIEPESIGIRENGNSYRWPEPIYWSYNPPNVFFVLFICKENI